MEKRIRKNSFLGETLAPLILVIIFTLSAIMMITIAAVAYKKTVVSADYEYYTKTSLAYIIKKIHREDEGNVSLGKIGDTQAVVIKSEIGGKEYATYLYQHEGYLQEVFAPVGTTLKESAGSKVMRLKSLDIEYVTDNLIRITCVDEGGDTTWGLVGLVAHD